MKKITIIILIVILVVGQIISVGALSPLLPNDQVLYLFRSYYTNNTNGEGIYSIACNAINTGDEWSANKYYLIDFISMNPTEKPYYNQFGNNDEFYEKCEVTNKLFPSGLAVFCGNPYDEFDKDCFLSLEELARDNPEIIDHISETIGMERVGRVSIGYTSKTMVNLTTDKKKIYVGSSTIVKANVVNSVGDTIFKSENCEVARVNSNGVVKGVKSGSAVITAVNNGESASVRITVVKMKNTLCVKGKTVTAKAKRTTVFTKTKAFIIRKGKGLLTFKKVSGNRRITIIRHTGKIIVKKGLKKNRTYLAKFKVTAMGNRYYKRTSKTVSVKIKVI
ncbi:MAG: hypothetical protein IJT79_10270 [Ruminococcus sp.]|nr:hypothetical protein [Ruminococcus sp.]